MKVGEITETQADLIKSFAIFYLLLVGNYIGSSIFTCFQINYIQKNKWLQLCISFLLFYFLVTLVSDTGRFEFVPPIEKLLYSLLYFVGFLMVMRLDLRVSALVLFFIFILYFLELNKQFYLEKGDDIANKADRTTYESNQYWITFDWPVRVRWLKTKPEDFKQINRIERVIYYAILLLLAMGFVAYGGEIRDTVKQTKHLTWIDVMTDTEICRLKNRKSFWHYLRAGFVLPL